MSASPGPPKITPSPPGIRREAWTDFLTSRRENNCVDTLILDFSPPELGHNIFLLFQPLSLWWFVTAVNKYTLYRYILYSEISLLIIGRIHS